jgi:hypothetical protein
MASVETSSVAAKYVAETKVETLHLDPSLGLGLGLGQDPRRRVDDRRNI